MAVLLGIDVGTQGAKALLYDVDSRSVVGRGAQSYELLPIERSGAAEQHPETWIDGAARAVRAALACVGGGGKVEILGMAVSGQQHGFVALDGGDEVIRPAKLWCDTETAPEAAELARVLGQPIPAGFTASKILWLKRHEPANFARLQRVLLPHDFVNLYLTGRAVMEAGDASGTGFFDSARRTFDARAMAAIDARLAACLPPLVAGDTPIGVLRAEAAARLGLTAGIPVAAGSGDNMMSALGAGAVAPGILVISLGTSGTLFGRSDVPIVDGEGLIAPFCDAAGAWLPLLCTMNCTTVTEEVRSAFGLDLGELTRLASREAPGCDGLTFLPYLAGERAPNWPLASGVLHGMRGGSLRPGLLFRAAMEGASLALLSGYERMRALGMPASELRLVGGAARNPLWRRMLADAFGVPVCLPAESESAALGAALQAAAVVSGRPIAEFVREHGVPLLPVTATPDPEHHEIYQAALARHRKLGQTLFG